MIRTLRRIAGDLRTIHDCDDVESLVISLELAFRELRRSSRTLDENEEAAFELVKTSLGYLRALADDREKWDQAPPVVYTGNVGRPMFEITRVQMNFLVKSGFTGPQIASIIGVSLSTVRRRITYFGLSISVQYTSIMDSELDDLVRERKQYFPM